MFQTGFVSHFLFCASIVGEMDRHQAKEILARYRPGESWGDPQVGEALEFARNDPQLAEWFKERSAHGNGAVVSNDTPAVPAEAGRDVKPAVVLLILAAAFLIAMLAWALAAPKPMDPFVNYRERMVRFVRRAYPVQISVTELAQVRDYFRTNAGPVDFPLPHNLEKLQPKGCAVFTWHSHPVGLMSFDAGGNTNLSLFLIPRDSFPVTSIPLSTDYAHVGKLLTASWTDGNRVYLLAGPDDPGLLKNYVE